MVWGFRRPRPEAREVSLLDVGPRPRCAPGGQMRGLGSSSLELARVCSQCESCSLISRVETVASSAEVS